MSNDLCQTILILKNTELDKLKQIRSTNDKKEMAGSLSVKCLEKNENGGKYILYLDKNKDKLKKGDEKQVEKIEARINWHTHPEASYSYYKVENGIPSNWDYRLFLVNYCDKKINNIFHIVLAREGFYVISMHEDYCNIDKPTEKFLEQLMKKYGVIHQDVKTLYDVDEYINKMNEVRIYGKQLFVVNFQKYDEEEYTFNIKYARDPEKGCDI